MSPEVHHFSKCVRYGIVRFDRAAPKNNFAVKDLLTFIIKVYIEFIFWDNFFVNSFIICEGKLGVISKYIYSSIHASVIYV